MNDDAGPLQEEARPTEGSEFAGAPEISRRVGAILDAVEREAQRLREEAREEANRYLEHARHRADGLVAERQRRIAAVSDELLAKAEAVVGRLEDAAPVREGFENLVRALGDAAERLARETEATSRDYEPEPFHEVAGQPPPAPPQPQAPPPPSGMGRSFAPQPHPARAQAAPAWSSAPSSVSPRPPAPNGPSASAREAPASSGWRQIDDARMVAIQMATTGATRAGVREHLNHALGVTDTAAILDEIFGTGSGEDAQVPWTAAPR